MNDNYKIIKCPACGVDMLKVELPDQKFNIDICLNGCGGIYFDNRELECADEKHENIDLINQLTEESNFMQVDQTQDRICPVCGTKMVKHKSKFNQQVEIDECYNCGGNFLDNSELQKIRENIPYEETDDDVAINNILSELGGDDCVTSYSPMFKLFKKLSRF